MTPRRQILTFLESLRGPVAEMTGLPPDAVGIYAQQDIMEHVQTAVARCQAAVLLGASGWTGAALAAVGGPPVAVTLEVAVWTPEVLLSAADSPTVTDLAEALTHGLHGRVPPDGSPGRGLIPQFRDAAIYPETDRQEGRWLVARLTFTVPLALRPALVS